MNTHIKNVVFIVAFLVLCFANSASAEIKNIYIEKAEASIAGDANNKIMKINLFARNAKNLGGEVIAFTRYGLSNDNYPVLTNFKVDHRVDNNSGLDVLSARLEDEFIGKPHTAYTYSTDGGRISNLVSFCFKKDATICDGFVSEKIPYLDYYKIGYENDLPKVITLVGTGFTKDMDITINNDYYVPNSFVDISGDGTTATVKIPDFVSSGLTLSKDDISASVLGGLITLKLSDVVKDGKFSVYLKNKSKHGANLEGFPINIKFSNLMKILNSRITDSLEGDDRLDHVSEIDLASVVPIIKKEINVGMKYGASDKKYNGSVTELQSFLNSKLFLKATPTGYFGKQTELALKEYQKLKGLPSTGYFGSMTKEAILNEK